MPRTTRFWRSAALLLPCVLAMAACQTLLVDDTSVLSPHLQRSEVVGFVAGFGTTFASLPDLLAMLRKRSSAGVNLRMATILMLSQFAWTWYGLLIDSRPIVLWNVIGIVINGLALVAHRHFSRRERHDRLTGG